VIEIRNLFSFLQLVQYVSGVLLISFGSNSELHTTNVSRKGRKDEPQSTQRILGALFAWHLRPLREEVVARLIKIAGPLDRSTILDNCH
jgi:hypothetical protein